MNYEPIFNKMTVPTFDKFIEINDLKISKGTNKESYQKNLLKSFEEDSNNVEYFQDFYKKLEEAGRKHFYLYELDKKQIKIENIREVFNKYEKEINRNFDPELDDNKIFVREEDNILTAKKIQIRRIYIHLDEDEEINDILTKKYKAINVHYITFVTFDYNNNRIICGYDSCGDLLQKKEHEKELKEFVGSFIPNVAKLEKLLTSDHIEKLKFLPNCLAYSINSKANAFDSANFKKSRANFDKILKELRSKKYKIDEIKDKNPDFDLQSNVLYTAGISASMDNDFTLTNEGFEFYFFSDKAGKEDYFRLKLDVSDGSITTFSESITRGELWDVFRNII